MNVTSTKALEKSKKENENRQKSNLILFRGEQFDKEDENKVLREKKVEKKNGHPAWFEPAATTIAIEGKW